MLTLSLPRCFQMMIRIKQVSVKPCIKRPLRKRVRYRPPQLSSRRLFSKKTDVLVGWQMSRTHRRWPTARLSKNSNVHAEISFFSSLLLSGVKIYGLWNPNGWQGGLFFFDCSILHHHHPWTVCLRLMPVWSHHTGAKDDTLWDCAVTLFLLPDRAFPYNRGAVLRAEKVQCVAGAELLEDPGRSSCGETGRAAASVRGLRFEGQQACDRGLVQPCNSVGFIEDLFLSVCCSIKLREEKFWTASPSLVDLLILTQ